MGFIQAFSFKYSPRPGTPGASLVDRVPDDVQSDRLKALQALLDKNQKAFNHSCIGTVMPVLLDRCGRKPGQLAGKTPYMQAVHVTAPEIKLGDIVELRILEALPNSLSAALAPTEVVSSPTSESGVATV